MGKGDFSTYPEPKLPNQSTPNFERLISTVKSRELPNLGQIGSTGASPHVGEMYTFTVFASCSVIQATDHNSQRILM